MKEELNICGNGVFLQKRFIEKASHVMRECGNLEGEIEVVIDHFRS